MWGRYGGEGGGGFKGFFIRMGDDEEILCIFAGDKI